jgi:CBS-domain-containing membrane protein
MSAQRKSKLQGMTVADLPKKEKLVTVDWKDTLASSFQKLFQANVLSAPVLKDEGSSVAGLIDLVDVAVFAIAVCKTSQDLVKAFGFDTKPGMDVDFTTMPSLLPRDQLEGLLVHGLTLDCTLMVSNFSKMNPLQTISTDASLTELVDVLSKHHRVVVLDDQNKLVNYITQTDLLKFLHKNNLFTSSSLKAVGMDSSNVISITSEQRVIEGFKLMTEHRISSVAVLDKDQRLIGHLSAKDIRAISASSSDIILLYQPYQQFLASSPLPPSGYISCNPSTTLESLVDDLVAKGLHHAYVMEGEKVNGVMSIGDLLRLV